MLYEKKSGDKTIFDLVDGQQRFTTLWLIAVAFKMLQITSDIEKFLKVGDELRIDFAIRKQIKSYMLSLLEKQVDEKNQYSDNEIESDEYLTHIAKAVTTILGLINNFEFQNGRDLTGFGSFIYQKVLFVANTVPENTDLNRLFAIINNSGVQLEQSDILKSLLLKNIKTEKSLYSRIWEACENMNSYFEKNVEQLFPQEFDWVNIQYDNLKELPQTTTEENPKEESNNAITIADILQGDGYGISELLINPEIQNGIDKSNSSINITEGESIVFCRSIINFPQLLLHAYRIFLKQCKEKDFQLPFHSDRLLQIFKDLTEKDEQTIKKFFKCLWQVRWVFDKEVVKWIQKTDEKEEELLLTSVSKDDNSFSRANKEKSEISMLQTMLYFTGNYNTQIWLTPYLKQLIDKEDSLSCLEDIDNKLSLSTLSEKETSFALMDKEYKLPKKFKFDYNNYLKENQGTYFKHYWFQKLEYILWKEFNKDKKRKKDDKFIRYRITSRNSIEHIFPQHHKFEKKLEEGSLHSFGNLALLNVSQNSSYSNKSVSEKQGEFKEKPIYDSLKLALIYEDTNLANYNEEKIKQKIKEHRDAMIEKIIQHYET